MKQGADDLGDFLRCFFAHFSIKKEVIKKLIKIINLCSKETILNKNSQIQSD